MYGCSMLKMKRWKKLLGLCKSCKNLPGPATGLYYRDIIGNISTSAVREGKSKTVMEVRRGGESLSRRIESHYL